MILVKPVNKCYFYSRVSLLLLKVLKESHRMLKPLDLQVSGFWSLLVKLKLLSWSFFISNGIS